MGCLIAFIVCVVLGIALAIPLAGLIVFTQSGAKKEAKKILATGRIVDIRKVDRILGILAKTTNDLEAADLWKKLQNLKDNLP